MIIGSAGETNRDPSNRSATPLNLSTPTANSLRARRVFCSIISVADRGGAIGASRWWWLTAACHSRLTAACHPRLTAACHPRLTRLTARWSGSTWQASKPSYAIIISSSVNTWGKFGAIVLALGRGTGVCYVCI